MPRIADTRTLTLDDARGQFESLARAQIRIWKRQAAFDDRVAALKSKLDADNQEDAAAVAAAAGFLREYILANKDQFVKPRKVKTPFGTFGLETEKELEIQDEQALLQELMDRGYEDCMAVTRKILKKPITARIEEEGESFPGCRVLEGDVVKYKVDRSLADEPEPAAAAAAQ